MKPQMKCTFFPSQDVFVDFFTSQDEIHIIFMTKKKDFSLQFNNITGVCSLDAIHDTMYA